MKFLSSLTLKNFSSYLTWKLSWTPSYKWSPLFQGKWTRLKLPATQGFTIVHYRLWNIVHGSNLKVARLDFLGEYPPSLSINYVGMSKDIWEKGYHSCIIYYICILWSGFIANGDAMTTYRRHYVVLIIHWHCFQVSYTCAHLAKRNKFALKNSRLLSPKKYSKYSNNWLVSQIAVRAETERRGSWRRMQYLIILLGLKRHRNS